MLTRVHTHAHACTHAYREFDFRRNWLSCVATRINELNIDFFECSCVGRLTVWLTFDLYSSSVLATADTHAGAIGGHIEQRRGWQANLRSNASTSKRGSSSYWSPAISLEHAVYDVEQLRGPTWKLRIKLKLADATGCKTSAYWLRLTHMREHWIEIWKSGTYYFNGLVNRSRVPRHSLVYSHCWKIVAEDSCWEFR